MPAPEWLEAEVKHVKTMQLIDYIEADIKAIERLNYHGDDPLGIRYEDCTPAESIAVYAAELARRGF